MRDDIKKFIILYIECFLILFIMGIVIPHALEQVLNQIYDQQQIHQNSILVGRQLSKPLQILYKYVYTFTSIVR